MKAAGVQPKCEKNENQTETSCEYKITDFSTYQETDGCGGGKTSFGSAFVHANGTKYEFQKCEGTRQILNPKPGSVDITARLNLILGELDMPKNSGSMSYIDAELIKCTTYGSNPSANHCTVKGVFEY